MKKQLDNYDDESRKDIYCVVIDNIIITLHGPEATQIMRNTLKYRGPINFRGLQSEKIG